MNFREIRTEDIPVIFDIRTSTYENPFSREGLFSHGITEESLALMLSTSHSGWVCEDDNEVIGFCMADGSTGELWVIAVLPNFESRGIGSRLLTLAEHWLSSQGYSEFWLWTSTDTSLRAYQLYRKNGWTDSKTHDNQRYMTKLAEQGSAHQPTIQSRQAKD